MGPMIVIEPLRPIWHRWRMSDSPSDRPGKPPEVVDVEATSVGRPFPWGRIVLVVVAVVIGLNLDHFRNGNSFMRYYDRYNGLIPLLGGVYLLLLVTGVLPRRPKNPAKLKAWRERFGPALTVLSPLLMIFGVFLLLKPAPTVKTPGSSPGAANNAGATDTGAQPIVYRTLAGTPGADGWYLAESTAGHFKVSLPGPFNDFSIVVDNRKGIPTRTSGVGAIMSDGLKFSASILDAHESIVDPQKYFDDYLVGFKGNGMLKESKRLEYRGRAALEASVETAGRAATIRMIPAGSKVYFLIAEYDAGQDPPRSVGHFLDSLEFAPDQ